MNPNNSPQPISPSFRPSLLDPPNPNPNPNYLLHDQPPPPPKKRRNLPGTPDPTAEVVALSPRSLMATNRFLCEVCGKGFQREQNLQLHRRGHNLPWKLRQRTSGKEMIKKVYVCPVDTCVHHEPSRALGDLTGIKKHYSRKHGEKKWKCCKCAKKYAVQSDWKAHSKTCGTREYKCDCGTVFSRKDSFITHRAFCDALMQETARLSADALDTSHHLSFEQPTATNNINFHEPLLQQALDIQEQKANTTLLSHQLLNNGGLLPLPNQDLLIPQMPAANMYPTTASSATSATALLQKAAQMGASTNSASSSVFAGLSRNALRVPEQVDFTRDFLGVGGAEEDRLGRSFFSPELAGFAGMYSALDMFGSMNGYKG